SPTRNRKPQLKLVTERAVYIPPPPLDTERGLVAATTTLLLQKMIADSYEHGREVWRENKRRCARMGECVCESGEMCGPNPAQKKVDKWLVSAGLLAPEESEDEEDYELSPPCTSPTSPSPSSPRGPLSPKRLWNAVQRSTTSLPLPKRPKFFKRNSSLGCSPSTITLTASAPSTPRTPRRSPRTPFKPSADPNDSILATALKRAAMLQTLTYDDADAIMRRHRAPPPMKAPAPDASWYVPPIEAVDKEQTQRETVTSKRFEYVPLEDPRSFRWPETPSRSSDVDDPFRVNDYPAAPTPILSEAEPEVRWYHALLIALVFHIFILLFAVYATLRVCFKPAVGLVALYWVVFVSDFLMRYVL
ncbi:hypothetical protein C8F01DRAFT_1142442, partial [Mycena amicta]